MRAAVEGEGVLTVYRLYYGRFRQFCIDSGRGFLSCGRIGRVELDSLVMVLG